MVYARGGGWIGSSKINNIRNLYKEIKMTVKDRYQKSTILGPAYRVLFRGSSVHSNYMDIFSLAMGNLVDPPWQLQ